MAHLAGRMENLVQAARAGTLAGGMLSWVDDIMTGAAQAAGTASKVAGPVFGGVGAVFSVVDMGFAIHEVLQKNPTLEQLEKLIALVKLQILISKDTSKKIHKLHQKVSLDDRAFPTSSP